MSTTKTTSLSDRAIVVAQTIRAPAARIFAAYTDPKQVAQWWGFPKGNLQVERMDVSVGGGYRYRQRTPDGNTMFFSGSYLEVKPVTRLVYTYQVEGLPGPPVTTTVELAEAAGATTVTLTLEFSSKEHRDAALQFGAAGGAKAALKSLAAFVEGA